MEDPQKTNQSPAKVQGKNMWVQRASELPDQRKSHVTPEELEEFRQVLLNKRRELIGDGDASSLDRWEQALAFRLMGVKQRSLLHEVDDALRRIQDKTYGICEATNTAISKARLRAIPWTRYCTQCARKRESGPL